MARLSPELRWRIQVLAAKLTGDLSEVPLANLLGWLTPGSPVYLMPLADNMNPHAAIKNGFTGTDAAAAGKAIYLRNCSSCHSDGGHGQAGAPNLSKAVAEKSDWSFFAAAKWGRAGTSMQAQPLSDTEIWQVHAYLRRQAMAATPANPTPATPMTALDVDVTPQSLLEPDAKHGQWLTYAGNYAGHRHSPLTQINKANVSALRLAWAAQLRQVDRELQVSPIVAGTAMYVTESREGVVALDVRTGAVRWTFRRAVPDGLSMCCGMPNRGVAVLGKTVFVAAIDAQLIALDANMGKQRWISKVADWRDGYTMTGAPLALADRVIVGVSGGEFGARGFIAAFDATDGRLLWTFHTVPGPDEFGHDSWGGESWKTGGAPTWSVGAYDPQQDLILWGTGNPAPAYAASTRPGDNLFSNSVVALEAKTGRLRWYYQFTPADEHDWDSNQQPMLAEIDWQGRKRSVVLWANRNAFFYALDRRTGEFLFARPFVKQTWNEGFDARGRPRMAASARPSETGALVWPSVMAATNWWPPSYDRTRQLVYVPWSDAAGVYYASKDAPYRRGQRFDGGAAEPYARNQVPTASI
ncbi:MAG TPA: PQQ-binding-like beta-propeller repeat protein, partial [Burkholderiaceae bacterium]|nr:PQQ-binding-like beta-propeller repeat protein [Burkholderiaceae bacterium]